MSDEKILILNTKKFDDRFVNHGSDGGGTENLDYVALNALYTSTGSETAGTLYWNQVDGTLSITLNNGSTLDAGQEMYFYGKASGAIANGDLVQFAGVQGDHILMKKAVAAEVIANPSYFIGVATQNISNGVFGYVTWFGYVNNVYTNTPANQDSQNWLAGDILYFSNSTGQLTKTEPVAPEVRIQVAAVVRVQTGTSETGKIIVRPTIASKLKDLSDVDGSDPNATGDLLTWNQTSGVWERNSYNITDYGPLSGNNTWTETNTFNNNVVINEPGDASTDFRVESDTEANMVYLDANGDTDGTLYLGGNTNGIKINKGGELTLIGTATRWNDLRVEPVARTTGTKAPSFTAYKTNVALYDFDDAVEINEKEIFFSVQMPHDWKEGSTIYPHVHWVNRTSGTTGNVVKWVLDWTKSSIGGTFGATNSNTGTALINGNDITAVDSHLITPLGTITMTNDKISTIIICRLYRNSSDAADTYTGTAGLLYLDFHYEIDTIGGSKEEYIK